MSKEPLYPRTFRNVLGQFCTGITVITTMHDGAPVGFACQSFAALSLQRDAAALDARFRLADVQGWLANDGGNPLPPLDAHLRAPLLELDGARLEGVEATLSSPEVADGR